VIGGGAEAIRTGQSAVDTFAKRAPDYSDQMMTPKQKLAMKQKLTAMQDRQEQFYYGEDQKRYLRELEQEMNMRKALLEAEVRMRREAGLSQRASAQLEVQALGRDIAMLDRQRLEQLTPTAGLKAQLNLVPDTPLARRATNVSKAKSQIAGYVEGEASLRREVRKKLGLGKEATDEEVANSILTLAAQEDAKDAEKRQAIVGAAVDLLERGTDGETGRNNLVNGLEVLARKGQTTVKNLLKNLDRSGKALQRYEQAKTSFDQEYTEKVKMAEEAAIRRIGASRRTHGGSGDVGKLQQEYMGAFRDRTTPATSRRAEVAAPEAPSSAPIPQAQDVQVSEQVQEQAPAQPQEQDFLGVPGLREKTGAQAKTEQLFDVVEQFPENTPAKQAKSEVMGSQEFTDYKAKHFGDKADDNLVWKEMVRDFRKQRKDERRTFRENKLKKRLAEMSRPLRQERKPASPVKGSEGVGDDSGLTN
tara:strand:- start:170 stop:1594 length:1425 start_codon:yes stop_codon:yes gene_type:complete